MDLNKFDQIVEEIREILPLKENQSLKVYTQLRDDKKTCNVIFGVTFDDNCESVYKTIGELIDNYNLNDMAKEKIKEFVDIRDCYIIGAPEGVFFQVKN